MAAEGFSDDIEFLWFLLSLAVEKSSQGTPGVRSETSIVPGQVVACKTSRKQTSSDKCVPVKVDYVGPRPMAASRSDQSNPTYNPTLTKNSNSAVTGPLASDRNVPAEAGYGRPNNISSETDSASEPELDCEGRLVKKEHEVDTDNEQEITFDDTDDEQERNLDNHDNTNLTSQLSSGTVGSDIKKEGELLETDLGHCMNTSASQQSFGTVGTEDDPDWDLDDGDNTNLAGSEAEEEIVPVYRDDFEESEAEFSRSEDDEQGHKSDDSWHPPSERKKIKVAKESSESITSTSNSNESSCERESKPKKPWVCKCGEIFDTQSLYYKHKVEAHPKICEICNERFPTMNALNVCRRTHMSDEEKANLSERDSLAFCDLCRGFFSRRKLKKHIKLVHGGQQIHFYVDTWQDNTRQRDGQLKEDKPVVKRRRRRKLEVPKKCEKKCEPVPCTWEGCEKTFTRRNTMTAHLLSHTGERSHLCSYCGQMFLRQDHLKVHLRIHTGDMPYKCHLCSYSGRQSNCLKSHMKTHHPEYCQEPGDGRGAEPTQDMDTESEVLETSEQCSSPPGISFRPLNFV